MDDSYKENQRLGIKVPRSTLLPPYLSTNPYFVGYTDAIDAVMGPAVDDKIAIISNIRNMWIQNPQTETYVDTQQLMPTETWSTPDRDLVVHQVNMLGMNLHNAGVVSDDAYQTIARFVGLYWFGKGTYAFMDFINYCLQTNLQVQNQWTENYSDFFSEGDPAIGTPIWEGGTWYPTTHVLIEAYGGFQGLDIRTLQSFFYEIANYNLVLLAIDASFNLNVVDSVTLTTADIVGMAGFGMENVVIANFKNVGASPPPINILNVNELPTTYYSFGGVIADPAVSILMGEPSGWMYLDDAQTMKAPVYSQNAQTVTMEGDVGVQLFGTPKPGNEYDLLYGPVTWYKVSGFTATGSSIPTFSTDSFTIQDGIAVDMQCVGVHRNKLLTNPAGFFEIAPGQFVPYWN